MGRVTEEFSRGSAQRLGWESSQPWEGFRRSVQSYVNSVPSKVHWIDSITPPGRVIPDFPERSRTRIGDEFHYDGRHWVLSPDGFWYEV